MPRWQITQVEVFYVEAETAEEAEATLCAADDDGEFYSHTAEREVMRAD